MRQTTIHLPTPCHESWAAMPPTEAGRHCAACQTQVVDFTGMTDGEVVAFLRHNTAVSCGRFRESQLSRPLLAAARPVAGWRRWLGATAALLGLEAAFGAKAQAQADLPMHSGGPMPVGAAPASGGSALLAAPATAQQPVTIATFVEPQPIADSLFLVQGVVRNWWGVRKVGARVSVGGIRDTTNAQGGFRILVPKRKLPNTHRLRVFYYNPHNDDRRLTAIVPFDPAHTSPYHIRLHKPEIIRGGKFR